MKNSTLLLTIFFLVPGLIRASECDTPDPNWLMCEDFEGGGDGWQAWFAASSFTECNSCPDGANDPARILLTNNQMDVYEGSWALHMPAEASAGYQGSSLTFRSCSGEKRAGCPLAGYEQLYFRVWVKLAPDHQYMHHFLNIAGTKPDAYWESDGNAGCKPDGMRYAGTTLDFNRDRELFFYTYYPEMNGDQGGYCSGDYVQNICDGCAAKNMPCNDGLKCYWGNHFGPEPPVIMPRGEWAALELMLKLNTPLLADGEMAFWLNGTLAHRETGMHWRDTDDIKLNKAWLQHYVAGGDAGQSNRVWFDNMVVSTRPIGVGTSSAHEGIEIFPSARLVVNYAANGEVILSAAAFEPRPYTLEVRDLKGRLLFKSNPQSTSDQFYLDLQSGAYIARIIQGQQTYQTAFAVLR